MYTSKWKERNKYIVQLLCLSWRHKLQKLQDIWQILNSTSLKPKTSLSSIMHWIHYLSCFRKMMSEQIKRRPEAFQNGNRSARMEMIYLYLVGFSFALCFSQIAAQKNYERYNSCKKENAIPHYSVRHLQACNKNNYKLHNSREVHWHCFCLFTTWIF